MNDQTKNLCMFFICCVTDKSEKGLWRFVERAECPKCSDTFMWCVDVVSDANRKLCVLVININNYARVLPS